jgi:hypothetical protein
LRKAELDEARENRFIALLVLAGLVGLTLSVGLLAASACFTKTWTDPVTSSCKARR